MGDMGTPETEERTRRVSELARDLIRFDTQNPPGRERACVEHLERIFTQAGIDTHKSARNPDRPNLLARLTGRGAAPPFLMYGHVDVVTVDGQEWTRPPFEGDIVDGVLWGRGALDMKGGVAMMATALLEAKEAGLSPPGDLLVLVLSDEEGGSADGATHVVEERAEWLDGVRYAIGEFGAFSLEVGGQRFYPIQVAEKRWCTLEITVRGRGGHGSTAPRGGAMAAAGRILTRLDERRLPPHQSPLAARMITAFAEHLPRPESDAVAALLDPNLTERILDAGGEQLRLFDLALHNTVSATQVHGAERADAVPEAVRIVADGRVLPEVGTDEFLDEVREACGEGAEVAVVEEHAAGLPDPDLGLFDTLAAALTDVDPQAHPVPMVLPGVTDARFLARLGIQSYGFLPMRLPPELPFTEMIHGANERIPVDALDFGVEVLDRLLARLASDRR